MTPQRVRCSRVKGRPFLPDGARYVGRGQGAWGQFGNLWRIGDPPPAGMYHAGVMLPRLVGNDHPLSAVECCALFRRYLSRARVDGVPVIDRARELAGLDVGCWCPTSAPCHGDLWLAAANDLPTRSWVVTCGTVVGLVEARTVTGAHLEGYATWGRRSFTVRAASPADVTAITETAALTVALRSATTVDARRHLLAVVDTAPIDEPALF